MLGHAIHLTLPKGGSHWVTDVLSDERVLANNPGLFFRRCEDFRLGYWAAQREGFFCGPMFSVSFEEWEPYRRDGFKAIHVGRDPRDAIVSMTFSFAYSHETQPHIELIRPILLASDMRSKLMLGMYQYWQSSWIERSWAGRPTTDFEYATTYERIVADEFDEFRAMLDFLGWNLDDAGLREAIDYHSFERRARGRERGTENKFSHYRRGVAGDWRNYFDKRLGLMFERACPNLLVEMGYETTNTWHERLPDSLEALADDTTADVDLADVAVQNQALRTMGTATVETLRANLAHLDDLEAMLRAVSANLAQLDALEAMLQAVSANR